MAKINTKIKLILLVALGQGKQKLCIPLVGLAPVRLLRPSMAVLHHVNGKLQRAYWCGLSSDRASSLLYSAVMNYMVPEISIATKRYSGM